MMNNARGLHACMSGAAQQQPLQSEIIRDVQDLPNLPHMHEGCWHYILTTGYAGSIPKQQGSHHA
jgi:hypothetical protein